jgi:hypothetical protein
MASTWGLVSNPAVWVRALHMLWWWSATAIHFEKDQELQALLPPDDTWTKRLQEQDTRVDLSISDARLLDTQKGLTVHAG